jgi:outer membrane receptor protein involved in Fe transport
MKKLLPALLCLFMGFIAQAQTTGKLVTIRGTVIDSATKQPVSYATIALRDAQTSQPVKSTLTKDNGSFELVKIPAKSYQLAMAFVGYQSKYITLKVTDDDLNLGQIKLVPAKNELKEVSVTALKPVVKQEVDRIGYSVQNDPEVKSLTALDMMRKVPMLSVDGNNNIKLRGQDNYKILINGKESSLMARNPSDVLKAMPASNIEKIEVITTPPAKYDAEGLAGIINIITKKNGDQGYNGNISARYNNIWGPGINFNGSVKQGKFGLNGYVGYNKRQTLNNPFNNTTTFYDAATGATTGTLMQDGSRANGGHNTYANAELSFEADTLNLITGSFSFYNGSNLQNFNQFTLQTGSNVANQSYRQINSGEGTYNGKDAALNYQLGFKRSKEQLLTLSYKYSSFGNKQNTDATFTELTNYEHDNYRQFNNSGSTEHTIQADYAHPVKKLNIEVGGKAILRNNYSDFHNDIFNNTLNAYVTDPTQNNNFDYKQNVLSFYNTYSLKLEKWAVKGGLRLENTKVDANFTSTSSVVNQNYNNLVPSFSIQRSFKTFSLTAGFTQRIQRPGIWQLNPFVDSSNVKYISQGNPNLRPAVNNNIELNYSNFAKGSINLSVFYSTANNTAQSVTTIGANNVSYTTYQNAGKRQSLGINGSTNYPITKQLTLNLNGSVQEVWIKGTYNGDFISNKGLQGYAFSDFGYKIKDGFRVSANVNFDSRWVLLQGKDNYWVGYGFSSTKDILKGKGSISLSLNNPFKKFNVIDFYTRTPDFYTVNTNYNRYSNIFVGFTYKFGKLNAAIKKNQKGIQNDDVSSGGNH